MINGCSVLSNRPFNNEPFISLIKAMLIEKGVVCKCLMHCENENELLSELRDNEPHYIGLSMNYDENFYKVINVLKLYHKEKNVVVILFGMYANSDKEYLLTKYSGIIDYVIVGEPEVKFIELVASGVKEQRVLQLVGGKPLKQFEVLHGEKEKPDELNTMISRGCFNNCLFCDGRKIYGAYRYKSVESVIEELKRHISTSKMHPWVFFSDLDFLSVSQKDPEWFKGFYEKVKEQDMNFNFSIQTRADRVPKNVDNLKLLKEIGLKALALGVETGSPDVLVRFNKGHEGIEVNRKAMELLRDIGIPYKINFIMFDPLTTMKEIEDNLKFIDSIDYPKGVIPSQPFVSFFDKVKIVPGGKSNKYYVDHGAKLYEKDFFIEYSFLDDSVNSYYDAVLLWREKVKKIYREYYLMYQLLLENDISEHDSLHILRLGYRLRKIDLEFLKKLSTQISLGNKGDETIDEFYGKLQKVYEKDIVSHHLYRENGIFEFRGLQGQMKSII